MIISEKDSAKSYKLGVICTFTVLLHCMLFFFIFRLNSSISMKALKFETLGVNLNMEGKQHTRSLHIVKYALYSKNLVWNKSV